MRAAAFLARFGWAALAIFMYTVIGIGIAVQTIVRGP